MSTQDKMDLQKPRGSALEQRKKLLVGGRFTLLQAMGLVVLGGIVAVAINRSFDLGLTGLFDLSGWGYLLVLLGLTHITIASVTIFLHRHQAHRALDLHPIASHFFRFWLWVGTGMETKAWAAIHRKHHARCETEEDPHSPQVMGLRKVLLEGAELYRAGAKDKDLIEKYGAGTPDDWLERNLYTRFSAKGIFLMLAVDLLCFGVHGIWIWAIQMAWIPFWAAGFINGVGHFWGYRNFECADASTNVFPLGLLIGGEEFHNNHHTFGTSAKLSVKWWEFDIGWLYICLLSLLGLATVRRTAPQLHENPAKSNIDGDTLQALVTNRYRIAANYAQQLKHTVSAEFDGLRARGALKLSGNLAQFQRWLEQDRSATPENERVRLDALLAHSHLLATIYRMRQELTTLWERSTKPKEQLLAQLQDWCMRAEASGIETLHQFSQRLRHLAAA